MSICIYPISQLLFCSQRSQTSIRAAYLVPQQRSPDKINPRQPVAGSAGLAGPGGAWWGFLTDPAEQERESRVGLLFPLPSKDGKLGGPIRTMQRRKGGHVLKSSRNKYKSIMLKADIK